MNVSVQNYLQHYLLNQPQKPVQTETETDLLRFYTRTYATVNLDIIRDNVTAMKKNCQRGTGIIAVVKADAYGHGAVPVARSLTDLVSGFAVATIEEAMQLRRHGIVNPVMILGVTNEFHYHDIIKYSIRPTIFTMEQARKLSEMAESLRRPAIVHLALDTGMSRIGMTPTRESADMVEEMSRLPYLQLEGLFTHFSRADEADKTFAERQLELYLDFVNMLEVRDVDIPIKHCSNSAGIIDMRQANLDAVRAGIAMYGLYPSEEVDFKKVPLLPALEWKSFITYIKIVPVGTPVSYGGTFVTPREMVIATIPIGYGDGYPRNVSNKGSILVHGKRARILGRVCMDQMMVDVTNIPEARVDDEVTLVGMEGEDEITVEELAEVGGGFHYEIVCNINKRVPRVYLKSGQIYGKKDYFKDRYDEPRES